MMNQIKIIIVVTKDFTAKPFKLTMTKPITYSRRQKKRKFQKKKFFDATKITRRTKNSNEKQNENQSHHKEEKSNNRGTSNDIPNASYHLKAIVLHNGFKATFGHYVTDVHFPTKNKWKNFNDSIVTEINKNEMCSSSRENNCYILFYIHSSCADKETGEVN
eukprot:TRINITY_DN11640_c0_g2_i1.p1 TRINITY_DN11640_c0_g2~~TRINITY_DN11640_c0_g2_i1.p1  ORF type:complete len:162 (-),score=19.21 TRINITY_DN11640_c0_g2_i1:35-520(-)